MLRVLAIALPLAAFSCSTEPAQPVPQRRHSVVRSEDITATPMQPASQAQPQPVATAAPQAPQAQGQPQAQFPLPTGKDGKEYKDIRTIYGSGQYDSAISRMAFFERKFPKSPQLPQIENLNGMAYLMTLKPQMAITHFRRSIAEAQAYPAFIQYVLYNLASAQFEAGMLDDVEQTLVELHPEELDKDTRMKAYYLKSRYFSKRNLPVESAREALSASRLDARSVQSSLTPTLDQALAAISDVPTLESLYKDFEDSPLADLVLHRLATEEIAHGQRDQGEDHLKMIVSRFPQSTKLAQAMEYLNYSHLSDASVVEPNAIGVLLPLSGRLAQLGTPVLEAIEMGFGIFGDHAPAEPGMVKPGAPGSGVTLVLEDSGDDPDQAVQALERLVFKHHVIAVIGPLMSKGIDQVTQRAEELSIPLVSLARGSGIQGTYVFQAGLTQQLQAQQVARYAIQKLGLKKFAVLYPKDKLGGETANSFWDAVESMGGEIVGAETYNPGETDFRQQVDKLSGLYYTDARERELDALAKLRKENDIKRRTRRTEQYFALPPVVDYEAVFIPDEAHQAALILPTFAYRDVDQVKFLGTAAWNFPEIAGIARSDNALFVDAFDSSSTAPNVRAFLDGYRATYGFDASVFEAVAYDAARLVDQVLAQSAPKDRSELVAKLRDIHDFDGVTGKISCDKGLFNRDLKVFTVRSGRIVDVDAPNNRAAAASVPPPTVETW